VQSATNEKPQSRIATERREQILAAALRCFARGGFHQTSMAEVCAEAKLSPGSVYRYFRSKDDIIAGLAVAEHHYMNAFYETVRLLPTLREAVDTLIDFWMNGAASKRSSAEGSVGDGSDSFLAYIEIVAEATRNPRVAALTREYDAAQLAIVREILEIAKKRGQIDVAAPCDMLARLLSATLDGMMLRCVYDKSLVPDSYRAETRRFLYRALGLQPEGYDAA